MRRALPILMATPAAGAEGPPRVGVRFSGRSKNILQGALGQIP